MNIKKKNNRTFTHKQLSLAQNRHIDIMFSAWRAPVFASPGGSCKSDELSLLPKCTSSTLPLTNMTSAVIVVPGPEDRSLNWLIDTFISIM